MRALAVAMVWVSLAAAQEAQPNNGAEPSARYQYFSGIVQSIEQDRFTVQRTLPGQKPVTRLFLRTSETRVEGTIRAHSRVTVRFVVVDDGNQALYVLVRTDSPGK